MENTKLKRHVTFSFSVFSMKIICNFLISSMSCCKSVINIINDTMPQTPDTYIKHRYIISVCSISKIAK